ncbi:hypothetical protein LMG26685_02871 [Achromobacter mucicolens]|uniref:hypothetical protein n=1 Tax=Achromobacter mucicolens TaxID=1389922 RepID=UPI0009CD72D6|nr:hypothetical protein [Achromobacter mucicolens]CAB3653368.1 hypothetical protein LMG26685_02871 [Achromobacter mucicolens]
MTQNIPGISPDAKAILSALHEQQEAARRDSDAKHDALQKEMLALSAAVKTAFPGGDFDGHRRYHELLISREEQRQQIRREVITHLIKVSTWGALTGLAYMLLRQLKDFLQS